MGIKRSHTSDNNYADDEADVNNEDGHIAKRRKINRLPKETFQEVLNYIRDPSVKAKDVITHKQRMLELLEKYQTSLEEQFLPLRTLSVLKDCHLKRDYESGVLKEEDIKLIRTAYRVCNNRMFAGESRERRTKNKGALESRLAGSEAENRSLLEQIAELERRNAELEKRNAELEKRNAELKESIPAPTLITPQAVGTVGVHQPNAQTTIGDQRSDHGELGIDTVSDIDALLQNSLDIRTLLGADIRTLLGAPELGEQLPQAYRWS